MKLWSHSVAQGGRRLDVPGLGTGTYIVRDNVDSVVDADPPQVAEALREYARDEQEALSRRYGRQRVMLMVLRSGKIAVFDSAYQLLRIAEGVPTKTEVEEWTKAEPPPTKSSATSIDDLM